MSPSCLRPSGRTHSNSRFDFAPGDVLAQKYEVIQRDGYVRDGELYTLSERSTGIGRSARFFYPAANRNNQLATRTALRLHELRHCPLLPEYRTQETIQVQGEAVTFLVADLARGQRLSQFLAHEKGHRLGWFSALHFLHALAKGLESLHAEGEAHGALAFETVVIRRAGLGFEVQAIDFAPRVGSPAIQSDVLACLRLFRQVLGSAEQFARTPQAVRRVVLGMKRSAIASEYRDARALRRRLEAITWE